MYYIGAEPASGKVFAGKVKQISGDEYEWEEREDCTSSFFGALINLMDADKTLIVKSNGKPKYKFAMTELAEAEVKDIEVKEAEAKKSE